jgi:hypothetical protein
VEFEHLSEDLEDVWDVFLEWVARKLREGAARVCERNSRSISCWMIIVNGPKSACSNVGSVVRVPATTNLTPTQEKKRNISTRRKTGIESDHLIPHQSGYTLKNELIEVGITRILRYNAQYPN